MASILIRLGIAIGSVVLGLGANYYLKLKPDNPVEQLAEQVIEQETGLKIDLTP
jgi:hypothetical protein